LTPPRKGRDFFVGSGIPDLTLSDLGGAFAGKRADFALVRESSKKIFQKK
jgi:hypothetical protein